MSYLSIGVLWVQAGLQFFSTVRGQPSGIVAGLICIPLIISGGFKLIESVLKYMIIGFTGSFLIAIFIAKPQLGPVLKDYCARSTFGFMAGVASLFETTSITGYLFS